MTEDIGGNELEVPRNHIIDFYTPENIKDQGYDSHLQDALSLLRMGPHELIDINGVHSTIDWQSDYTLTTENTPGTTKIKLWEQVQEQGREPFLLVDWNTKDGVVGVVEGREYTYAGTDEKAIFINWIVVKNSGTNDDDIYTYRGQNVASRMYDKVESVAREHGVKLLIAGINTDNPRSAGFHTKQGFRNESFSGELAADGSQKPHRTPNGAFIPPYSSEDTDSNGNVLKTNIDFYTKRLQ